MEPSNLTAKKCRILLWTTWFCMMFAEGKMHHSASFHHIPSALRKKTTSFCVETRMTPFPLCWDQSKVLFENSRSLEYWGCPLDASATGRRGASVGPDEVQWSHGRCIQHANLFLFVLQCGGPEMDEMTMDDWDGSSRPTVSVEFQENILGKEVADWGFRCSFFLTHSQFGVFLVFTFHPFVTRPLFGVKVLRISDMVGTLDSVSPESTARKVNRRPCLHN